MIKILKPMIFTVALVAITLHAAEEQTASRALNLSPELLELLRAEMREVTAGVQGIVPLLATANWAAIAETSEKIRASYIMEKSLTPAQSDELETALPEQFKQLDAEFHQRADKLRAAAAAHDAELVIHHYTRLLESCVRCHSAYAGGRFPGYSKPAPEPHTH